MTQRQLDRAVARTTGESLSTVRRLGFSPLAVLPDDRGQEPPALTVKRPDAPRPGCLRSCAGLRHTAA